MRLKQYLVPICMEIYGHLFQYRANAGHLGSKKQAVK